MVKIKDVARAAGVSPATVSRVLNGTGKVSDARAQRVRAVVARLGYQPFSPARALRLQATAVWAVIVADIENPFFTLIVRGIEDAAHARGYRVVLCNSDEDLQKEAAYIDVALAERMGGVVIAVASARQSQLAPLLDRGVPVVAIDRRPAGQKLDCVLVDNRRGAAEATEHLLEVGARRIACITGPRRVSTANERLAGYEQALRAAGRKVDPALIVRENFRPQGGYDAIQQLCKGPNPPDAVFVANNLMTVGALRALRELGRRVPDDVRVVGFDDAPWAPLVEPPLTVVSQPAYEIGRIAAGLLCEARENPDREPREVMLAPELIVRGSSGASRRAPA